MLILWFIEKYSITFCLQETLTGFKWMASKAHEAINNGMKFVFAFEEAIGKFLNDISYYFSY